MSILLRASTRDFTQHCWLPLSICGYSSLKVLTTNQI